MKPVRSFMDGAALGGLLLVGLLLVGPTVLALATYGTRVHWGLVVGLSVAGAGLPLVGGYAIGWQRGRS
jgi:hypothetical protein